jgi:hypothetical protein
MIRAAAAMVWGAGVTEEVTGRRFPDCSACRPDPSLRDLWGCEEPAPEPVFSIGCSPCGGEDCERCEGSGERAFFSCPGKVLEGEGGARVTRFVRAYLESERSGNLPVTGGQLDQTDSWRSASAVLEAERGRWEMIREDHRKKQRRRAAGKR